MLAGTLVTPLASFVGRPIERLRGVTGRLARENTLRNPSRTATTSAALMIGVALVVFAAVFASSATKSVGDALDETFAGDLIVANTDGFSPISPDVARQVAKVEGVETVSPLSGAPAEIELSTPKQDLITGLDPGTLTKVAKLDWVDGDDSTLTGLGAEEAIVESQWAEDNGVDGRRHADAEDRDRQGDPDPGRRQHPRPRPAAGREPRPAGRDAAHAVRRPPGLRRSRRLRARTPTPTRPRTESTSCSPTASRRPRRAISSSSSRSRRTGSTSCWR